MTVSAQGIGGCEILCAPFKSGVSTSYNPPALKNASPTCLKARLSGGHLSGAGPTGWGAQCGAQTPLSLRGISAMVIILPFVGHLPRVTGLDYTVCLPLLPLSLWFLLYIFSCRKSFLLVFRSFSSIVALYVFVILVCPWEEVSSGSSYSAMLAPPQYCLLNLKCLQAWTVTT